MKKDLPTTRIPNRQILQACMEKQEKLIADFESRIAEMREDVFNHAQSSSQTENRSSSKMVLLTTLESELGFARVEMGYLKSIDPEKEHSIVEPGAVVLTNLRHFFIAVSSEIITIDEQAFFGISTQAPLYHFMQGKKTGDQFEFNGTVYQILDVY